MKFCNIFRAIICVLLVFSMVFAVSCSNKKENAAIYGLDKDAKLKAYMTEGMFSYFLSEQKNKYFAVLCYNDPTITRDTPDIWERKAPDGVSFGEKLYQDVIEEAKNIVAANTILYSLQSPDDSSKSYELPEDYLDYVSALVKNNAIEKYGSVMDFESYLLNFGTTLEDYTNLYIMTANTDLLKDAMFSDTVGIYKISDAEIKKYYADNYYSVKHIFINTVYDEKIDGTRAPLTEAETQRREEVAQNIFSYINAGGSYEAASSEFTQSFVTVYPSTSQMDISSSTANAPELGEALKKMSVGETRSVKSSFGYHIIQRVETNPEEYNKDEKAVNSIRSAIANKIYPEIIDANKDLVYINDDILSKYSMATAILP